MIEQISISRVFSKLYSRTLLVSKSVSFRQVQTQNTSQAPVVLPDVFLVVCNGRLMEYVVPNASYFILAMRTFLRWWYFISSGNLQESNRNH